MAPEVIRAQVAERASTIRLSSMPFILQLRLSCGVGDTYNETW